MYIMKKTIFSLVLLLCCMVAEKVSAQVVSPQQAIQFARSIVGNDSCDYYLAQVGPIVYPDDPSYKMMQPWLVFVDEEPNSGWEHPCKYVYINRYQILSRDKDYFVVDSVCPPDNIKLVPAYKPNRYGEKGKMKPSVPKVLSNDSNPAAENTYAVILNGGMCLTSNNERYWNDCSFIYKTLRNTYGIPKRNIKVIMSDGTDEGEDMNMIDGRYCSSPLDLDDDSIPDIEYAATKENLQTVLNGMAQKLTDDDHLMIFVTGHGGYDYKTNSSYMYLWKKDKLYPNELNSYLEPIDAGFISIVMGQCYSGGFIEPLKKPNRIIATACDANERSYGSTTIPFDEFLYHWTSAVNGYDAYGKKMRVKENIPILDAQAYAAKNDVYANDKAEYGHEVPQINYFTHSVAYDLSLANIPPVVDLCFDAYRTPVTSELLTKSYVKNVFPGGWPGSVNEFFFDSHRDYDMKNKYQYEFWCNPYIWIRNQNDGKDVHVTEKPVIEKAKSLYVYVQVRNKGVKTYTGGMDVKTFWAKSSAVITEDVWKGRVLTDDEAGGSFCTESVSCNLAAGDTHIVELEGYFVGRQLATLQENNSDLCILAFLKRNDDPASFIVDENDVAEVWNTDKLGQSNVTCKELKDDGFIALKDSLLVGCSNLSPLVKTWHVDVRIVNYIDSIQSKANVALRLSPNLMEAWNNGDQQCINIKDVDRTNCAFQVESDSASLGCIKLQPYQQGKIGIKCNFFAENDITEKKTFDVNVAVRDDATGKILGGETFRITQHPRPAINPQIESLRKNGMTTLTATNVSENVIYKWYDAQGTLVGEGETFAVPAGMSATSYKVKAEALSDGAISYSASVQAESSSINSVQSTTGAVNVILEGPANGGTTLRLASATGNVPVMEYSVEAGSTVCNIPADNLPSGVYQVTMVENGVVTGIKKFTK